MSSSPTPRPASQTPRPKGSSPTPTPFQPVRNAAREGSASPLPTLQKPPNLQARATDFVLNSIAILGDMAHNVRSADRFFKYKALALGLWLCSAAGSFGIACLSGGAGNSIGARLIVAGDAATPIYMVKNNGGATWQDVEITVNSRYRSTLTRLDPMGTITLSPSLLFDASGHRAASDLRILDLEVRVADPNGSVSLLHGGLPQKE